MAEEENRELKRMLENLQSDIDESRSCNTQFPPMAAGEPSATKVHGIYRVPDVLRVQNEGAYRPSCVSIGPLYRSRREEDLKEMEAVKKRYMGDLLERNGTLKETLKECSKAMLKMESGVWQFYNGIVNSGRFLYDFLHVRDGCFIIELLYRNCVRMPDPILQNHLKYNQVRRDLLLLENQIPFFVLEELFRLTVERIPPDRTAIGRPVSLRRCLLSFFGDMMGPEYIGEIENLENNSPCHILHFLHICYQSRLQKQEPIWYKHKEKPTFKYSATKLHSMGVEFGPGKRVSLFDLKFTTDRRCFCLWRRAHFKIPRFSINESTESFLRNFIAFEHSCPGIDKYFTSYAFAMSILLDSAEDVELLEEAGVIRNKLGFRDGVSELFKDITSHEIIVRNQKLAYKDLWMQLTDFCTPWRLALANVNTQMAVAAVIILNLITLLSSVYTVLSYYRN